MMDEDVGLKVFSATRSKDRETLGELITSWLRANPHYEVFDRVVLQSSDAEYHCLSITLAYRVRPTTRVTLRRAHRSSS